MEMENFKGDSSGYMKFFMNVSGTKEKTHEF